MRAVSRKAASWQQARSAPKLAKKKQLQLVLPGTLLRAVSIKQTASWQKVSPKTRKEEAASVVLPGTILYRRDWETQGEKRETRPQSQRHSIWHLTTETARHSKTSGRQDPAARVTASRIRPQRLGDKRETPPWSQRHSIWHLTAETQANKRETPPRSQHHSIWHPDTGRQAGDTTRSQTLGDTTLTGRHWETSGRHDHGVWHQTAESGRHRETSGRHDPKASVTASSMPQRLGARPWSQRHSIWHLTAETGRHRETSAQHLASDRRDWETQGDKRETRPWSQRHGISHLTGETGRQEDKWKTRPRNRRHTFPFCIAQVRTPMLCCLGN